LATVKNANVFWHRFGGGVDKVVLLKENCIWKLTEITEAESVKSLEWRPTGK
jgi:hypothetical protein